MCEGKVGQLKMKKMRHAWISGRNFREGRKGVVVASFQPALRERRGCRRQRHIAGGFNTVGKVSSTRRRALESLRAAIKCGRIMEGEEMGDADIEVSRVWPWKTNKGQRSEILRHSEPWREAGIMNAGREA